MINILLSTYNFDNEFCYKELKDIIKPNSKVVVLPFAHDKEYMNSLEIFEQMYHYEYGSERKQIIEPFYNYGISNENIYVLNPFQDSIEFMKYKIRNANILFAVGGNPVAAMMEITRFNLESTIKGFNGVFIGASAGAMIQVNEFTTYPNGEGYEYDYHRGLGLLDSYLDIMVHYEQSDEYQNDVILKSKYERPNIEVKTIRDGECLVIKTTSN